MIEFFTLFQQGYEHLHDLLLATLQPAAQHQLPVYRGVFHIGCDAGVVLSRFLSQYGIFFLQIIEHVVNGIFQAVKVQSVDGYFLFIAPVVGFQPFAELQKLGIAPHPLGESFEWCSEFPFQPPVHIVIHDFHVGPVGLGPDDIKSFLPDQGFADFLPHAVKLAAAVGGFSEEHNPGIANALKKGLRIIVLNAFKGNVNLFYRGYAFFRAGLFFGNVRQYAGLGNKIGIADKFSVYLTLCILLHHFKVELRPVGPYGHYGPSAFPELRFQCFGNFGQFAGYEYFVERSMVGPAVAHRSGFETDIVNLLFPEDLFDEFDVFVLLIHGIDFPGQAGKNGEQVARIEGQQQYLVAFSDIQQLQPAGRYVEAGKINALVNRQMQVS